MDLDPKKRPVASHIVDRIDKMTCVDYSKETSVGSSSDNLQTSLLMEPRRQRITKLHSKRPIEEYIKGQPETEDPVEYFPMLREDHHTEKEDEWEERDVKQEVNRQSTDTSSSNSSVSYKFNSLNIFDESTRRIFVRNGGSTLENVTGLMIFSKKDIRKITENNREFLVKGSYDEVYKGTLSDNTTVAVKPSFSVSEETQKGFTEEVEIHAHLTHKNILKLVGCCLEVDVPLLVYEFIDHGSLEDILHGGKQKLCLDLRLDIAIGSAEGLRYMHSYPTKAIWHGYIRSSNILLDDSLTPKLSDFGSLNNFWGGCVDYADPTGLLKQKGDIYSFGVVLLELITRKRSVYKKNCSLIVEFRKSYDQVNSGRAMFDEEIASEQDIFYLEEIGKLAMDCLKQDIKDRPDMAEVKARLVRLRRDRRLKN